MKKCWDFFDFIYSFQQSYLTIWTFSFVHIVPQQSRTISSVWMIRNINIPFQPAWVVHAYPGRFMESHRGPMFKLSDNVFCNNNYLISRSTEMIEMFVSDWNLGSSINILLLVFIETLKLTSRKLQLLQNQENRLTLPWRSIMSTRKLVQVSKRCCKLWFLNSLGTLVVERNELLVRTIIGERLKTFCIDSVSTDSELLSPELRFFGHWGNELPCLEVFPALDGSMIEV